MSVTVQDILQLDILKDSEIVAGKKGLQREVLRVNFTDCPVSLIEGEYALVSKGDLYIRSLYWVKDDEEQLYNSFYFYITSGSCCCLITREFLSSLPKKILDLANENQYPIIVIDYRLPYGDLIKELSELIMTEQSEVFYENKINRLLYENLTSEEVLEIGKYINPYFKEGYVTLLVKFQNLSERQFKFFQSDLKEQLCLRIRRYPKGGFITFNYQTYKEFEIALVTLKEIFLHYDKNYCVGISQPFDEAQNFNTSVRQAASSAKLGSFLQKQWIYYEEIHTYNLLLSIKDPEVLKKFCLQVLSPLEKYGTKHNLNLIKTVELYLNNNGDYKKTAKELDQHENTIRFRISKAKSLLGMEYSHYKFVEEVSLALKAKRINQL